MKITEKIDNQNELEFNVKGLYSVKFIWCEKIKQYHVKEARKENNENLPKCPFKITKNMINLIKYSLVNGGGK
jgi:hypothetical protein